MEELSKYLDVVVEEETSEVKSLLEIVIRDALPIKVALEAGQSRVALSLVNSLLEKAQEYLDEI